MTDRAPYPREGTARAQLMWRLAFDLLWCCANLVKITDRDNKVVNLVFNRGQRWVYWNMMDMEQMGLPERLWILKGRQFGVSTMMTAINTIRATRGAGLNMLMIIQKERPGRVMFQKVERVLKGLPKIRDNTAEISLVPKPTTHNTGDVIAWNTPHFNALIQRDSGENVDAGVSETYQLAHLTEIPLWKDAHHTMGGFLPTMANRVGTSIVGEATARNEGDYFHGIWQSAVAGLSMFRAIFLAWYWHEEYTRPRTAADRPLTREEKEYMAMVARVGHEYPLVEGIKGLKLIPRLAAVRLKRQLLPTDLAKGFKLSDGQMLWRRDMIASMRGDYDRFRGEYPATDGEAFSTSGRRLVPPGVMDKLDAKAVNVPELDRGEYVAHRTANGRSRRIYQRRENGRVWRWEAPQAGAYYVIDCDPSSGTGDDSVGMHVLRVEYRKITVVASFQGKERPHEVARILARMGQHYRTDAVLDVNGALTGGLPSLIVVERNGFGQHVLYELDQTLRYRRIYRQNSQGKTDDWSHRHEYGLNLTKANKMPIMQHLVQLAYDDEIVVPCRRTLTEIRSLTYLESADPDKPLVGAPRGLHDDCAISFAEGIYVAAQKAAFRRMGVRGAA